MRQIAASTFRYVFKRATTRDQLKGIVAVQEQCFASSTERSSLATLENLTSHGGIEYHKFIVAAKPSLLEAEQPEVDQETVAAYIMYQLHETEGAHVISIGTAPSHQKQGHARTMMNWCVEHARERGCHQATLRVRASNLPAVSLYRSLGYVPFGATPSYYSSPVEDALELKLTLVPEKVNEPELPIENEISVNAKSYFTYNFNQFLPTMFLR